MSRTRFSAAATWAAAEAAIAASAEGESGHWVTIEGQHVFIRDGAGHVPARLRADGNAKKRFSRAAIQKHLIEHHNQTTGGGNYSAADERDLEAAAGSGAPFTFYKKLPTEIKEFMAGRPELRSLFKVSNSTRDAGGADAFGALGDRYLNIAEAKAGAPLRQALKTAHNSPDPAVKFLAAVHDNMPVKSARVEKQLIKADQLRVGEQFEIDGTKFTVAQDKDGYRVLEAGRDYPQTPVEALDTLPIDKGTLKPKGRGKREVIPFSADKPAPGVCPTCGPDGDMKPDRGHPPEYRAWHCDTCGGLWQSEDGGDLTPRAGTAGRKARVAASADDEPYEMILAGAGLAPGREIPLPAGAAADSLGQPVHRFRKEVARLGNWVNRGKRLATGKCKPMNLTAERVDRWVENFRKRRDRGITPFVPGQHRDKYNAADNHGWVVDFGREGDSVFAEMELIGDRAVELAAKNDVSIYVVNGEADAQGEEYDEVLEHVALTPNPSLPRMDPFVRIAASADGAGRDVPVFALSADFQEDSIMVLTPEQIARIRKATGAAATVDITPELAITSLLEAFDRKAGEVVSLSADKDRVVAELSADRPRKPDPGIVAMYSENVRERREMAVTAGIPESWAKEADKALANADGSPNVIALSACGEGEHARPFGFTFWKLAHQLVTGKDGKIATGTEMPRGVTAANADAAIAASADAAEKKKRDDAAAAADPTQKAIDDAVAKTTGRYMKRELAGAAK